MKLRLRVELIEGGVRYDEEACNIVPDYFYGLVDEQGVLFLRLAHGCTNGYGLAGLATDHQPGRRMEDMGDVTGWKTMEFLGLKTGQWVTLEVEP